MFGPENFAEKTVFRPEVVSIHALYQQMISKSRFNEGQQLLPFFENKVIIGNKIVGSSFGEDPNTIQYYSSSLHIICRFCFLCFSAVIFPSRCSSELKDNILYSKLSLDSFQNRLSCLEVYKQGWKRLNRAQCFFLFSRKLLYWLLCSIQYVCIVFLLLRSYSWQKCCIPKKPVLPSW